MSFGKQSRFAFLFFRFAFLFFRFDFGFFVLTSVFSSGGRAEGVCSEGF